MGSMSLSTTGMLTVQFLALELIFVLIWLCLGHMLVALGSVQEFVEFIPGGIYCDIES